ncbi:MAG TPA: glycosyl hydrolase 115 family protein [Methylomirabilota bacterium]|nr:glycosyl hydrolase 115 family protein [Methylomirabilota bacterium]
MTLALTAYGVGQPRLIEFAPLGGGFELVRAGKCAPLWAEPGDYQGVLRVVMDLATDIERVTRSRPIVSHEARPPGSNVVLVATLGRSGALDRLALAGKLDTGSIAGKWEAFVIAVVSDPWPGVAKALVIAGSDKRGTIYGAYELSEQIGVSPWYWWADVAPDQHDTLVVRPGTYIGGPPAVRYRGVFLNDEAPALSGWAREKFGGFNHRFYTNVFELLLRLKGNLLWPAMWNNSFATDDPANARLADEYGIVMGTSHHEPMMRAWKEWTWAGHPKGSWDYAKNAPALRAFWTEGLRRNRAFEKIITLGMRGDGDEPMSETQSVALLERIVADQRAIIAGELDPAVERVPQVWALYKEVQGYYEKGMRVPDDVTLLWCDDNWGHLRRLPTPDERSRAGGAGVYYHFDYVGGPRSYKWLNTTPLPKIWEQMHLADQSGAHRIWIVNVGDLKPMEFPIEFFLTFAWSPDRWPRERFPDFTRLWAEREFGAAHAAEIAQIIARYTKYNGRRKPELLEPDTYSLVHYREAETVLADWRAITTMAEGIQRSLPAALHDAFFQLVLHPAKASALVNELYITVGRNRLHAAQGRAGANTLASRARELFKADAELSHEYNHRLAGGKWNHLMDQTHIGYTSWREPRSNTMPAVLEIEVPEPARMGLAIEGSTSSWPGAETNPVLPDFDAFNQPKRYVEIFNRGRTPFVFTAETSAPWIRPHPDAGQVREEQRVEVSIDWSRVPPGTNEGSITFRATGTAVTVRLRAVHPSHPTRDSLEGFVEADGYVSMEAVHFTARGDAGAVRWEPVEDLGRTLSSMTVFPVTARSVMPPHDAPWLEYRMFLFTTGTVEVEALLAPSLNYAPDRGVRLALSFDDEPPRVVTVLPKGYVVDDGVRDWEESVKDAVRKVRSTHQIARPGYHALRVWMVDPGVVLQKLVVNTGGVRPSYLGPPESFRRAAYAVR